MRASVISIELAIEARFCNTRRTSTGARTLLVYLVGELWISGDLVDSRGTEKGASWTRFQRHLTLKNDVCQMQDISCMGNEPVRST